MQKLVSAKSKRNPWAAPRWLIDHPFWAFQLGMLLLSLLFLALTPLVAWMYPLALLTWGLIALVLLGGVIGFFAEGGWDDIGRWIDAKYDNYGKVED